MSTPSVKRCEMLALALFEHWHDDRETTARNVANALDCSKQEVQLMMRSYSKVIAKVRAVMEENKALKAQLAKQEADMSQMFPESWEQVSLQSLENMQALGLLQLSEI